MRFAKTTDFERLPMPAKKAITIFKDIENQNYSNRDKMLSILIVIRYFTNCKSLRKKHYINALRWIFDVAND